MNKRDDHRRADDEQSDEDEPAHVRILIAVNPGPRLAQSLVRSPTLRRAPLHVILLSAAPLAALRTDDPLWISSFALRDFGQRTLRNCKEFTTIGPSFSGKRRNSKSGQSVVYAALLTFDPTAGYHTVPRTAKVAHERQDSVLRILTTDRIASTIEILLETLGPVLTTTTRQVTIRPGRRIAGGAAPSLLHLPRR